MSGGISPMHFTTEGGTLLTSSVSWNITSWKRLVIKFEPWSNWTDQESPTSVKNLIKAFTMLVVLMVQRGITSGKQVAAHILVTTSWLREWPNTNIYKLECICHVTHVVLLAPCNIAVLYKCIITMSKLHLLCATVIKESCYHALSDIWCAECDLYTVHLCWRCIVCMGHMATSGLPGAPNKVGPGQSAPVAPSVGSLLVWEKNLREQPGTPPSTRQRQEHLLFRNSM